MTEYCILKNNIIENIIVADEAFAEAYATANGVVSILRSLPTIGIGNIYIDPDFYAVNDYSDDLSSQADGALTTFVTNVSGLCKADATLADIADIKVLVDDVVATITAVEPEPTTGNASLTLGSAPAAGAIVKLTCKFRTKTS